MIESLIAASASSRGITSDSAKKQGCITVLIRPAIPTSGATRAASIVNTESSRSMISRWMIVGEVLPHLVGRERCVEQERAAVAGVLEHVEAVEEAELVAGDEVGLVDEIGRPDRVGPNRRCDTVIEPDFFES